MKKVCVFLFLFFGCSEGMNISCTNSTDLGNSTRLYEMCDVSAAKVGERLSMLCNVSESLIECASVANDGQTIRWIEFAFNAGSVFGWLWLGGRAVYKWLHSSPREDYMRSRFQQALSSELLGFLITVPSIISIFTDASWGNYLINAGPVLFGTCIQFPWDIYKASRSRKKNQQFDSFVEFIEKLEKDVKAWDKLIDRSAELIDRSKDILGVLLAIYDLGQLSEYIDQLRSVLSRNVSEIHAEEESVDKVSVSEVYRLIERATKFIKGFKIPAEEDRRRIREVGKNLLAIRKNLRIREKIRNRLTIELKEWADDEFEEVKGKMSNETCQRYKTILSNFTTILSNRLNGQSWKKVKENSNSIVPFEEMVVENSES